jgi:hypothetical protein
MEPEIIILLIRLVVQSSLSWSARFQFDSNPHNPQDMCLDRIVPGVVALRHGPIRESHRQWHWNSRLKMLPISPSSLRLPDRSMLLEWIDSCILDSCQLRMLNGNQGY